jgi:hypothetical protein
MNAGNGKRAAFRVSDIVSVVREISDAKCHGAGFWSFWLRRPPRAIFIQIDAVIASSREPTIYTPSSSMLLGLSCSSSSANCRSSSGLADRSSDFCRQTLFA